MRGNLCAICLDRASLRILPEVVITEEVVVLRFRMN